MKIYIILTKVYIIESGKKKKLNDLTNTKQLPVVPQVGEEVEPPHLEVVMGAPQMKEVLKLDWWQVL
jgi:hypothetical protein